MGSKSVTKAVAKKLKYYVDVKRREDAFDLTGPYLPPQEPMPQRPGPTLAYDGIHDRSLKHYFRDPEVKRQIGKLSMPSGTSYRENDIRRVLDVEMSKRNYKLSPEAQSPYLNTTRKRNTTPKHRPQALISVDEYLKTKKGSKQRKVKPNIVGKPRKAVRRSPPQFVSKNEHERLVNTAARLIAATEIAALPGNRYAQTMGDNSTWDSSQPDVQSFTAESSDTDISGRRFPRPPSRAGDRPPRWTPPRASPPMENGEMKRATHSKSSNNSVQSDTSENVRNQVTQRKTKKKETISPYQIRPGTTGNTRRKQLEPSLQHTPYRPQSARFAYWKVVKKNGLIQDKDLVNSYLASSDDELSLTNDGQKLFYRRSPKQNVPRIRTLTYEVYILTGECRGAGTEADIKITLFGDYGTSGERPLLKSMNHQRKFRRGQIDMFHLDSVYLGELQNIRIGHSKSTAEHGWFLEKVCISEGKDSNQVFEFSCQRWFSSQKGDGQIVRDIAVSGRLAESELRDKIDEYTSRAKGVSDEESDASYTSESSAASDDEKHNYSSDDDDQTPRDKTKKTTNWSGKDAKNKNQEIRKKTVSFEGENTRNEHDDLAADDKTKKSEDEYSSISEKSDYTSESSDSEDENVKDRKSAKGKESAESDEKSAAESSDGENSKGKSSKDQNSKDRNSKEGKSSEAENSDSKNSEGRNSKKSESSEVKNSKEEDQSEEKKEDDFWSVNSDKAEPIYYDLNVEDDEKHKEKNDSDHSSSPGSSRRSSTSASSRHDEVDGEERSEEEKEIENESEKKDSGDKQSSRESVRSDAKSDEEASKEYMAGFLAGVRATEHEKEVQEEDEQHSDEDRSDDEDDEQFIMRKGPSLHVAVSTGNTERVQELIQHNPSLKDQTDEKGWIPLHVGCAAGQLECIKLIVVGGSNLEQETPTGYTSMHLAAMNGHVNCMMVLFALGAEISCRTIDEFTPLHLAAMSGHVECVKWLLANRAKHDVTDANDRSPGDIAEDYGHEEVAELLKSFKKELTRTDSTLSHLMTYEGQRRKSTESVTSETPGTSNKAADGETGTGEENWVSDNDDEDKEDDGNEDSPSVSGQRPSARRPGSGRRPGSARSDDSVGSINRTDSITSKEEKQKLYERQRQQMKKRNSSFLDSIRMDVEDDFNTNF